MIAVLVEPDRRAWRSTRSRRSGSARIVVRLSGICGHIYHSSAPRPDVVASALPRQPTRSSRVNRFETNLRIPGPTSLPSAVREAGARQMINHRGPEFAGMQERIVAGLREFFGTANDIVLLSCAGTGGLEAAIVNTLSPGDRVLAVSIGAFGDRFAAIASTYGAERSEEHT